MITSADRLRRARALIDTPDKWCQGRYHKPTGRHCSLGAMNKAMGRGKSDGFAERALYAAAAEMGDGSVVLYNDTHTHAEVMALFDRAIEIAEGAHD